jgi:hypothetical protein
VLAMEFSNRLGCASVVRCRTGPVSVGGWECLPAERFDKGGREHFGGGVV